MKKRIVALVLSLVMLLSLMPAGTLAAGEKMKAQTGYSFISPRGNCGPGLSWTLEDGVLTVSGKGTMNSFTLLRPAPWYGVRDEIEKIVIGEGVLKIGNFAFAGLEKLMVVEFEGNAPLFGVNAFRGTQAYALYNAEKKGWNRSLLRARAYGLTWLDENSVTKEGKSGENVTYRLFPDGTLILSGSGPMADYPSMSTPWGNEVRTLLVEPGVTAVGVGCCVGAVYLEKAMISHTVRSIGDAAFLDCEAIREIVIPEGVEKIGMIAFNYCLSLESISFPASAVYIDEFVLYMNPSLKEVNIAEANPGYDSVDGVFYNKDHTRLILYPAMKPDETCVLADGLKEIASDAFADNKCLKSVWIPASLEELGLATFASCEALEEINVAEENTAYTSVDGVLFDKNMETLVSFPAGREGYYTVPEGILEIGYSSFSGCAKMKGVVLPEGLELINGLAFSKCSSLESMVIPASVEYVWTYAFIYCKALHEVRFLGDAPEFGSYPFRGVTADVYYPAGNPTWTEEVMQDYDGVLTWIAE